MTWSNREERPGALAAPEPPPAAPSPRADQREVVDALDQLDAGLRRRLEPGRAAPLLAIVEKLRALL